MQRATLFETSISAREHDPHLGVVFAQFTEKQPFTWELFEGFHAIRVLTYSASVGMVEKLIQRFGEVECVFGYEGVLGELAEIIAFQKQVGDLLLLQWRKFGERDKQRFQSLLSTHKLRFYVLKDAVAHSKIYLLEGEDRRRVIVGSANLTEQAFSGRQAETLIVFDNQPSAWEYYCGEYDAVLRNSTDKLDLTDVQEVEIRIERVPLLEKADATEKGVPVFINTDVGEVTVPRVIRSVERIADDVKRIVTPIARAQKGQYNLTRKIAKEIITAFHARAKEDESKPPEWLSIERETGTVQLSGRRWPLQSDTFQVRQDAQALVDYFSNFENGFYGDVLQHQKDYFAFACWLYFAPFICDLRNRAVIEQKYMFDIPVFAIIYGKSNCGKTCLIETLMQSMFGYPQFVDKQLFTRTKLRHLQTSRKRFPVVFDDVDKKQFATHAPDIIKDETFFLDEYPAFVLSMNAEDHSFPSELVKRCLLFYTQASLPDNDQAAKPLFNSIVEIRSRLKTDLYKEYLRRVIASFQRDGLPQDMLQFSSQILVDIFQESLSTSLPPWCRVMTTGEYKDKRYSKIVAELRKMYETNRPIWEIRKDEVILRVESFEAAGLRKDIPDYILKSSGKGGAIVMDRKLLEQFLNIRFGSRWLPPFRH